MAFADENLSYCPKLRLGSRFTKSIGMIAFAACLVAPATANAQVAYIGDPAPNVFAGDLDENAFFVGRRFYDQVDYQGSIASVSFERESAIKVLIRKPNGAMDRLFYVEAVSFSDQGLSYNFDEIFAPIDNAINTVVFHGTDGPETFSGRMEGASYFTGNAGMDQVSYEGFANQYVFTLEDDDVVKVTKPNGDVDHLSSIERVAFVDEGANYDIQTLLGVENPIDLDQLYHFGEAVNLVGANLAWSEDSRFSSDFGRSDGFGNPDTNLIRFQAHFDEIAQNGGNSARIWIHTSAQVSPNIQEDGSTLGLSRELTNQQVIDQLDAVLDSAWDRGILVTFSLFSFDMLCDHYRNDFGYTGSMRRNRIALLGRRGLYFKNALSPMVRGLKDHPALFAYEIFNEPEGAYQGNSFCAATWPFNKELASRFVNEAAATIHRLDSNVKVTTSTHTELFDDFSNDTLLSRDGADPAGVLDFYELHWYAGWGQDPYTTPKSSYNSDRPIIIGEFEVEQAVGAAAIAAEDTITTILDNGYSGAWPWSLAYSGGVQPIRDALNAAQQTPINKVAVETCIQNKTPDCYKD